MAKVLRLATYQNDPDTVSTSDQGVTGFEADASSSPAATERNQPAQPSRSVLRPAVGVAAILAVSLWPTDIRFPESPNPIALNPSPSIGDAQSMVDMGASSALVPRSSPTEVSPSSSAEERYLYHWHTGEELYSFGKDALAASLKAGTAMMSVIAPIVDRTLTRVTDQASWPEIGTLVSRKTDAGSPQMISAAEAPKRWIDEGMVGGWIAGLDSSVGQAPSRRLQSRIMVPWEAVEAAHFLTPFKIEDEQSVSDHRLAAIGGAALGFAYSPDWGYMAGLAPSQVIGVHEKLAERRANARAARDAHFAALAPADPAAIAETVSMSAATEISPGPAEMSPAQMGPAPSRAMPSFGGAHQTAHPWHHAAPPSAPHHDLPAFASGPSAAQSGQSSRPTGIPPISAMQGETAANPAEASRGADRVTQGNLSARGWRARAYNGSIYIERANDAASRVLVEAGMVLGPFGRVLSVDAGSVPGSPITIHTEFAGVITGVREESSP